LLEGSKKETIRRKSGSQSELESSVWLSSMRANSSAFALSREEPISRQRGDLTPSSSTGWKKEGKRGGHLSGGGRKEHLLPPAVALSGGIE